MACDNPLSPPDQLLVNSPCKGRAQRFPSHTEAHAIKKALEAVFLDHQPDRLEHVPIFLRHELQASFDSVERVGHTSGQSCSEDAARGIDCGTGP